ncbi:C4-dicarboxylate transporter, DctQ subunit [Lentibacillus persicus]|uniref:C4-dicarboxylate transporter, DctQ subunit n=1 Tax=Lentibacillus persicus TaxID=640948 RepID=A0A1I1VXE9_9BACI|nr:TRAP transporter small permease [Lentibacillus persicus]SFD87647.1 C4-dicarboxylate transporter, DctQ subunit [Lentibacillus persicus]
MDRQRTINVLTKADQMVSKFIEIVCVILMASIVVTISTSVISRFVVFNPLNFANPLSKYLLIWVAFLGAGLAFRYGEHIAVDMISDRVKQQTRKKLLIAINVLTSVFLIAMIYYGFIFAMSGINSNDPLVFNISMAIPYLSVPVSFIYMLFQLNLSTVLKVLKAKDAASEL